MAVLWRSIKEDDFERVELAVRETERGRWFLDEFARRLRATDVSCVERAVVRLERRIAQQRAAAEEERERIRQFMSLLALLVDRLIAHHGKPANAPREADEPHQNQGARLSDLPAIDASHLVNRLKPFR